MTYKTFLVIIFAVIFSNLYGQSEADFKFFGKGEPILIINGGPGWSSKHMTSVAQKIADMGYQSIIYDQRGTGKSKVKIDSTSISLEKMVGDIEQIRSKINTDRITILGHSFGGMLAMAYASKYPEHIKKLILSAPGGCDLTFLDYYQTNLNYLLTEEQLTNLAQWTTPENMENNAGKASYNIIKNTIPAFLFHKDKVDTLMKNIDNNTWNIQTSNLVWQDLIKTKFDLKPTLHRIIAPTLIIQGRQDALGQSNAQTIYQLIPNAELVFLEESAHIMWLDQPEAYYNKINQFLSSNSSFAETDFSKILDVMKGDKKIESKIQTANGLIDITGNATFDWHMGAFVESFTLNVQGNEISGKAYLKYSPAYNRMELVQIDQAANSMILLNGFWNNKEEKLIFLPVKNYSQWGSTSTLKLKWEYKLNDNGTFRKSMYLNTNGEWKLQSYYDYKPM